MKSASNRAAGRIALAVLFVIAGCLHFAFPAPYLRIMPPILPWPAALAAVSGACEIAGGVGLLIPLTRRAAAYGLIALLIAVFPANVYMAWTHVPFPGILGNQWAQWARLPLQGVLIWWAWAVR